MKVLSLDTKTLQAFLAGGVKNCTEHNRNELRQAVGVVHSQWESDHAAINGMRTYSARPTPHPVGMKDGTSNLNDKELGWMEDTVRYQQYESFGTPSARNLFACMEADFELNKQSLARSLPRTNFAADKKKHGKY